MRRGNDTVLFSVGLIVGGLVTSAALVLLGAFAQLLPLPVRLGVVAIAAAAVAAREVGLVDFALPQNGRQVPQWMTTIAGYGALQFGFEMGTGLRTYIPTGLPHLLAITVLLIASPTAGLLAGLGFGLGRVAMLVNVTTAADPDVAYQHFSGIGRYRRAYALVTVPLLIALVVPV